MLNDVKAVKPFIYAAKKKTLPIVMNAMSSHVKNLKISQRDGRNMDKILLKIKSC